MEATELPLETSVEEVHVLLDSPNPPRLIDCREDDEWHLCRIDGAELVPLSQFGELARHRFTHPDEHLVIYCHHGMRSQRAALWLRQQGFARSQSMRGGIDLWSDRIDPSVPRY